MERVVDVRNFRGVECTYFDGDWVLGGRRVVYIVIIRGSVERRLYVIFSVI